MSTDRKNIEGRKEVGHYLNSERLDPTEAIAASNQERQEFEKALKVKLPENTIKNLVERYKEGDNFDYLSFLRAVLVLDQKGFLGIYKDLDEAKEARLKNPNAYLTPEQRNNFSELIFACIDLDYLIKPESKPQEATDMNLKKGIDLIKASSILNELSNPQKADLLEWIVSQRGNGTNVDKIKRLAVAEMFVTSGLLPARLVHKIVDTHLDKFDNGSESPDLAEVKEMHKRIATATPLSDLPVNSPMARVAALTEAKMPKIMTTSATKQGTFIAGMIGTYYFATTAIVNLALFAGDFYQNPDEADGRRLALAIAAGAASIASLNFASRGKEGYFRKLLKEKANARDKAVTQDRNLRDWVMNTLYKSAETEELLTNEYFISAAPKLMADWTKDSKTSEIEFAKAETNPRYFIAALKEKMRLSGASNQDLELLETCYKRDDKKFHYMLAEVAIAYTGYEIGSSTEVYDKFGYNIRYKGKTTP